MSAPPDHAHQNGPRRSRVRFELILAGAALAFGLFVLPFLVYLVGGGLLGPYGENLGPGAFYADFFRDLIEPAGRTWALALGPLALALAFRAVFIGVKERPSKTQDDGSPPQQSPARGPAEAQRVEPRVTLD